MRIEVPVLLRLGLGVLPFSPYILAGPAFAFEIDCDVEQADVSVACDDGTRKEFDFGLAGGAGIEFGLGPGSVLLEGRYTHGLTNLNDDPDGPEIKNRSFGVFGGYSISIGL
jgi:hypothetical protein